jgi:sulfate transporter 4
MPSSEGSADDSSDDRKTMVTVATLPSADDALADTDEHHDEYNNNGDNMFQHRPYVSLHRRNLQHLATDSTGQRRYTVPDRALHMHEAASGDDPNANGHAESSLEDNYDSFQCCSKLATHCRDALEKKTCGDWTETVLPMWRWLKTYEWRRTLHKDLIAGCSVGVMIVPQSMSYAKLAGLPVQYGLYSALVPVYAYVCFGSSRQLAVGPVALISLLLSTGLAKVMESSGHYPEDANYQELYNTLAVQTSFLVGLTYIFMGLVRLGFVTIFLSHAVISGFTTGAAVIIGMSQVKYIFGYDIERSDRIYEIVHNTLDHIDEFNWRTFLMGVTSIVALVGLKRIGKRYPKFKWVRAMGPLSVTAVTIILTVVFSLDDKGIPIVGSIPKGLPSFTASEWTPIENIEKLYMVVISIVIVGFMESIAIAKQLASKHKYEIDSSQELIGLGMANFLGAMFQSYPVTGSFSRSAVNNESGAQSGISGMVTATMVGVVLLFLTPVFEKLPLNVLAAIVISGVLGLLDYEEAMYLWRVHKFDFSVWVTACFGTMFLGVEIGLGIAVAVSLLIVIYESAYPHTMMLGRLPGTTIYRNIKQYPETEQYDGIVLVRIDAPLYFANVQNVRDKIRKYRLAAAKELADRNGEVKYIILEMAPVSHMDTSALHILGKFAVLRNVACSLVTRASNRPNSVFVFLILADDMNETYRSRGQQICFSNPSIRVMERLVASGFVDKVGREHFFACLHDAVQYCLNEMDSEARSLHESVQGRDDLGLGDALDVEAPIATPSRFHP